MIVDDPMEGRCYRRWVGNGLIFSLCPGRAGKEHVIYLWSGVAGPYIDPRTVCEGLLIWSVP